FVALSILVDLVPQACGPVAQVPQAFIANLLFVFVLPNLSNKLVYRLLTGGECFLAVDEVGLGTFYGSLLFGNGSAKCYLLVVFARNPGTDFVEPLSLFLHDQAREQDAFLLIFFL